jgi:endoglucanase
MLERFLSIAERLMRNPAAPFHELEVAREVERICREENLALQVDRWGNLLVEFKRGKGGKERVRPIVLAAHMDHPGFVIRKRLRAGVWKAEFMGGVGEAYFQKGVPLLLMPGRESARLGKRIGGKGKEFEILSRTKVTPQFAVWDLKDFGVRNGKIYGRACDDLIGVAAALTALIELKRKRGRVHAMAAITRGEEVGFHGALVLAESKLIAREALVISLETSRELPPVKMGEGVIIRVGDRASIFDSNTTRFLAEVGLQESKAESGPETKFKFQRALMSGGTCEGTAYQELGFQTAAVCVALGNYHNCGEKNIIREEFVSMQDGFGMAQLLVAAALEMRNFERHVKRLPERLRKYGREARANFKRFKAQALTGSKAA